MTESIFKFLAERKGKWLNDNKKPEDQQLADEKFSLIPWARENAKNAGRLHITSHVGKFTHPDAKISSILAQNKAENDGYLRTGNVRYPEDVWGDAAAIPVYKFLILKLEDGQTVLEHLEQNTDLIQNILKADDYEIIRKNFLAIKVSNKVKPKEPSLFDELEEVEELNESINIKTSTLMKQIYFPIDENQYHLLSIATPSGLVFEMKQRIDAIRFSEDSKQARECKKKNEYSKAEFKDLLNLTVISYGGTKPQNISTLNSQGGGKAYLLLSTPPTFEDRQVRRPTTDFFKQTIYFNLFKTLFEHFNFLFLHEKNNKDVRSKMDQTISEIIERIYFSVELLRHEEPHWSDHSSFQNLPLAQKIWLDAAYTTQRLDETEWLQDISKQFARWMLGHPILKNKLSDHHFEHIAEIFYEYEMELNYA